MEPGPLMEPGRQPALLGLPGVVNGPEGPVRHPFKPQGLTQPNASFVSLFTPLCIHCALQLPVEPQHQTTYCNQPPPPTFPHPMHP